MESYGVKVMSMGFLVDEDAPMIWRGPMVQSALQQMLGDVLWGELDVLVVDMPPGTGDAQLTMAQKVPLAGAVIVSTPQDIALLDARKAINMFRKVDVPVLGIVENMSYFCCPNCGHRTEIFAHGGARACAAKYGVDFLAEIPLDIEVRETSDDGRPIVVSEPDAPDRRGLSPAGADGARQARPRRRGGDAEVPEDRLQLSGRRYLRFRRLDPGAGDLDRLGQALALVVGLGVAEILLGVAQVLAGRLDARSRRAARPRSASTMQPLLVDLGEAAGDEDAAGRPVALVDRDHAGAQQRHQRRVLGQHAEIALGARDDHHVDVDAGEQPLGRDQLERHLAVGHAGAPQSAASFLAFSTASSMPPTM